MIIMIIRNSILPICCKLSLRCHRNYTTTIRAFQTLLVADRTSTSYQMLVSEDFIFKTSKKTFSPKYKTKKLILLEYHRNKHSVNQSMDCLPCP